jgi:hypothetical protein
MREAWKASSRLIRPREVVVLSRSTTPTGRSSGCPSLSSEVKKKIVSSGNITMQKP